MAHYALRYGALVLGPVLIVLACSIVSGLLYLDNTIFLPLLYPDPADRWNFQYCSHVAASAFFVLNVLHNYFLCVTAKHEGPRYDEVVRELAAATGYEFPETEEDCERKKREFEKKVLEKNGERRKAADQREAREAREVEEAAALQAPSSDEEDSMSFGTIPPPPERPGTRPMEPVRSWQVRTPPAAPPPATATSPPATAVNT